jgi:hypothetical protein
MRDDATTVVYLMTMTSYAITPPRFSLNFRSEVERLREENKRLNHEVRTLTSAAAKKTKAEYQQTTKSVSN